MDHVARILAQWQQERPDLDVWPMGVFGRFGRLYHHLRLAMEQTFARHGLTAAAFDVLATLRRAGAPYCLSAGELLATMMITSGTLTHRLDQLEQAGLISRRPNPRDGRGVLSSLTPAGLRVIEAAVSDHVATQHQLISRLPIEEARQLDRLLTAFLAPFEPSA